MKTTKSGNGNNKAPEQMDCGSLISVNILTEIRRSIFDKPVLCPKIVKSRQSHSSGFACRSELVKRCWGEGEGEIQYKKNAGDRRKFWKNPQEYQDLVSARDLVFSPILTLTVH